MASIRNQVAFVSGASSGIGGDRRGLAAHGVRLILAARRADRLRRWLPNCATGTRSMFDARARCQAAGGWKKPSASLRDAGPRSIS
jgi:NADP-dependent 3-hydroxy acid dehydrogenase YdfG